MQTHLGIQKLTQNTYAAIDAALDIADEDEGPIELLDPRERNDVILGLMSSLRVVTDTGSNVTEALRLYNEIREGSMIQMKSMLSPMKKITSIRKEAVDIANQYYKADELIEKLIHKRQTDGLNNDQGAGRLILDGDLKFILFRGDLVVFSFRDRIRVSSWEDLLGIRSISLFRANTYLLIGIDNDLPEGMLDAITKMYQWHDKCIKCYGNPGFELLKATESVFKARLMQIGDGPEVDDAFSLMIIKQREKEWKLTESSQSPLVDELEKFALSVTLPRIAAELFGALKFSGHPVIDPALASKSAREYGTKPSEASFIETMKMRAEFCDMLLRGHIAKRGRWPAIICSDHSLRLYKLYEKKTTNFSPGDYDWQDWYFTCFPKMLEFDYTIDFLDLMEDKSCGLDPEDAWKAWDSLKAKAPNLSRVPNERSKKVIIRVLSMDRFDPKEICEVIRTTDPSLIEISMALYPKEKEFKLEARLFVMLEFAVRVFLTLAEKNFKQLMKDYLPDQSMTKGRKATMQYLESMANATRTTDTDTCYIEIDLSRWNLLWRGVVVNPVSRVVDDVFGLPGAFSKGHRIFENSTVIVRVSSETPEGVDVNTRPSSWPEGPYIWRRHLGGFEGIIQGQWTACTQAAVRSIMRDIPEVLSYKLLGQGDNQILGVTFKKSPTLPEMKYALEVSAKITQAMEYRFKRLNQIVKPEECLVSRKTVTYSKLIWQDGIQIPTTLKHAATVAPVGTSNIPSLNIALSSLASGCRASADSFSDPSTAYLYFLIRFRMFLPRAAKSLPASSLISKFIFTKDALDFASVIPSDLGGFPVQGITDFAFGGCSDRLSSSTATLVCWSHTRRLAVNYLGLLDTDIPWRENPDPSALLEDPFAVPIVTSIGADVVIDGAMREVVPEITRNPLIKQIISTETTNYNNSLNEYLSKCRPFYPLVLSDLKELSVIGVRQKMLKKFTGTRTIQQLIRHSARINYKSEVIKADYARINRLFTLASSAKQKQLTSSFNSRSIFDRVVSYRDRWFPTPGVIKGVTVLHPLESQFDAEGELYSQDFIEISTKVPPSIALTTRGQHSGRWGDKTWEHRKVTGVEMIGKQKSALAAKRLLLLESQMSSSVQIKKFIRSILEQRTIVDKEVLAKSLPESIGGVMDHRWDSVNEEKAYAWLGPIMLTQHTSIQTDTMSHLAGGKEDYAFSFQENIFFLMQLIRANPNYFPKNVLARLHYKIGTPQLIENNIVKLTEPTVIPKIKNLSSLQKNPLVCAGDILFQSLSEEVPSSIAPSVGLPPKCTPKIATSVLVHYFLDQLENPLLSEASLDLKDAPAGLSFDVGSLIGAGLYSVIKAAGIAVYFRGVEMMLSTTFLMDRVQLSLIFEKLSTIAATPISRFANHPDVRCQEWVRTTGILIAPGRHGGKVLINRISSRIREQSHECLKELFNLDKYRIILSSYAERATPSRILGCYVALNFLILTEGRNIEAARSLFRKHTNSLRKVEDEKMRVAIHLQTLEMMREEEFDVASIIANELLEGRILFRSHLGFDETKRYLRTGDPQPSTYPQIDLEEVPFPEINLGLSGELPRLSDLEKERLPFSPLTNANHLIKRNFTWDIAGSSLSRVTLPILVAVRRLLIGKKCALIGVGNGAIARDLFYVGVKSIVGVDLLSDIPDLPGMGTNYLPPEIPVLTPPVNWRWAKAVFREGGDWFQKEVQNDILSEDFDIIVVDIQPGRRMIWKDLDPLISSSKPMRILFRRELSDSEREIFELELRGTFSSFYAWRSPFNTSEYWYFAKAGNSVSIRRPRESSSQVIYNKVTDLAITSNVFYPNRRSAIALELTRGRASLNSNLAITLDQLTTLLTARSATDRAIISTLSRPEIALSVFILSKMSELNSCFMQQEADVIKFLMTLATSPPPATIHGVDTSRLTRGQIFNSVVRIASRLIVKKKYYEFAII
jgi:hypothetical protein